MNTNIDGMVRIAGAAKIAGLSTSRMYYLFETDPAFPRPARVFKTVNFWRPEQIERWKAARINWNQLPGRATA